MGRGIPNGEFSRLGEVNDKKNKVGNFSSGVQWTRCYRTFFLSCVAVVSLDWKLLIEIERLHRERARERERAKDQRGSELQRHRSVPGCERELRLPLRFAETGDWLEWE